MKSVFRLFAVPFMLLLFALAVTGCGGGGDSGSGSKPSVPTNVKVTPGDQSAIVSWDPVAGATSYNIYYSTTKSDTEGVKAASGKIKIEKATSPYTVTGLTNGTVYYFEVTAVNSSGESGISTEVSTTPVPIPVKPGSISATGGNGEITVGWTAVANATSYNIYYSTTSGVTKLNGTKVANAVSPESITGLTNGTPYYFVVTAVNSAGESEVSAEKSATPSSGPQPPQPPKGVSATAGNAQVTVTWTNAADATCYNIYYGTTSPVTTSNSTKIDSVATPYTIPGLTNGTTYHFVVTATNDAGESGFSSEKPATPSASLQPPESPNGVKLANGPAAGQIKITWNTKLTATSYNIYYTSDSTIGASTASLIANGLKESVAGVDPTTILTQSYTFTGLTSGTTYYFVVTSQNSAGQSGGQNSPKPWPAP
jgi:hypothetical protein